MTIHETLYQLYRAKNQLEKALEEINTVYNELLDIRDKELKDAKKSTQDIEQER